MLQRQFINKPNHSSESVNSKQISQQIPNTTKGINFSELNDNEIHQQYLIALNYYHGTNSYPTSKEKAFELLLKCAERNHAKSMLELGCMYFLGEHSPNPNNEKNFELALKYWSMPTLQSNSEALYGVGMIYHLGNKQITRDPIKAKKFLQISADMGYKTAKEVLEKYYTNQKKQPKIDSKNYKVNVSPSSSMKFANKSDPLNADDSTNDQVKESSEKVGRSKFGFKSKDNQHLSLDESHSPKKNSKSDTSKSSTITHSGNLENNEINEMDNSQVLNQLQELKNLIQNTNSQLEKQSHEHFVLKKDFIESQKLIKKQQNEIESLNQTIHKLKEIQFVQNPSLIEKLPILDSKKSSKKSPFKSPAKEDIHLPSLTIHFQDGAQTPLIEESYSEVQLSGLHSNRSDYENATMAQMQKNQHEIEVLRQDFHRHENFVREQFDRMFELLNRNKAKGKDKQNDLDSSTRSSTLPPAHEETVQGKNKKIKQFKLGVKNNDNPLPSIEALKKRTFNSIDVQKELNEISKSQKIKR